MSEFHSCNVEVAKEVGLLAAHIFNQIYYWVKHNAVNNTNYNDGTYWTYNSYKAWTKEFPYATERQINYAIKKLIDSDYIVTGNYNKKHYDKTLWYTVTKYGYNKINGTTDEKPFTKLLKPHQQNCKSPTNKIVKPIPDSTFTDSTFTDYNIIDNTKVLSNDVDSSIENNSFLKTSKKPKQSRYDKYISIIDDFMFNNIMTDNTEIKELLINHLNMLIEMNNANNKQLYSNQYKGILNKFTELIREKIKDGKTNKQQFIKDSIQQSITKQWVNFFDIKDNNKNLINNSLGESFGYKYDYNLTDEEKEIDYSKKF